MFYWEDPQLWLQLGSKDETVAPAAQPNVPGRYVRDLQSDVNALGYAAGDADGWFGPRTQAAVRELQRDAGSAARQTQGSLLQASRHFSEDPPRYTGGVTGIVDKPTAVEVQRWKANRWQRPTQAREVHIEDVRPRLPINARRSPGIRRSSDVDRLVLHCTDAPPSWDVVKCAQYDINPNHISAQGCPTITYTYFVNADGSVQKCLSHDVVSWHAGNWNRRGLGVVLAYRATGNPAPPPAVQLEAASGLFARLCSAFNLRAEVSVVGHRELAGTGYTIENGVRRLRKECPGLKVDLDEFRQEVARRLPAAP